MPGATPPAIFVIEESVAFAPPASDGAHRLVWWLATRDYLEAAAQGVAQWADISRDMLERIVRGEVEPGPGEAVMIEQATGGEVRSRDWLRAGPMSWREPPMRRPAA